MDAVFLPGIELAKRYYAEVVRPLFDERAPGLVHSAALIGPGSEVLGFDSPRSADHNWGPRCLVLVGPGDQAAVAGIAAMLADELPATFLGWPTRFPDVIAPGQPVRHWVEVAEFGDWLDRRLGFDPRDGVGLADWLATPTQVLAEVTGGAVFHDGLAARRSGDPSAALVARRSGGRDDTLPPGRSGGRGGALPPGRSGGRDGVGGGLGATRAALAWYPDDVWRYVLACQWARIGQEEPFPGRCAEAGDALGSAVVASRLVRDLMRMTLLLHRRYPPYSKWLGSAFGRAPGSATLGPLLVGALSASDWPERERMLCDAYELVAGMHNECGLTEPIDVAIRQYHDRPYRVIGTGRFVSALLSSISAPEVRELPLIGAVDQFVDNTDALNQRQMLRAAVAAAQLAR